MIRAYDLVLYDLDGTLIETAPEIADAVNDTLRELGHDEVDEAQVARWIGHGTVELLVQALARAGGEPAAALRGSARMATLSPIFDRHYAARCGTRSRLYDGARETLAALGSAGVRQALVTNKERRHADRVLAAHGLSKAFDAVVCGDTLASRKPDPAGVAACLRACGVAAQRTLFVGDSAIDAATARNAGIDVWLLPHGYNQGQPVEQAAPDRVIQHLDDIRQALCGAGQPREVGA